ncbi:MAG: peptidase M4 family protein [Anaerolineae bacterium]|nr:MAG: peptidase M4 family protein [Anaerolineae bacterium]
MLKEIIRNGSEEQRVFALQTLQISAQFRGQRQAVRDLAGVLSLAVAPGKQRIIYDAQNGSQLPGVVVRREGDPPVTDPAVNEAYDGSGLTYDLFYEFYGRNSIDGRGLRLDSTVHYMKGYDNAFWNGQQMVYGDGDEDLPPAQRLFNRFTVAIDIIGHELTHGVTEYEAKLAYYGQSGALNESMSDVFGSLVKQYQRRQTAAEADWVIGQGLFTSNVNGIGIRSMKAPGTAYDDPLLGKDPQPGHIKDYVNTVEDNGGVHINSGIPNHAFYVTALEIGGYAWEKAGNIWYLALRDKLTSSSNFQQAADLTYAVAGQLYGVHSLEQQAVKKGWAEVGLVAGSGTTPEPPAPGNDGCLTALLRALGWTRV